MDLLVTLDNFIKEYWQSGAIPAFFWGGLGGICLHIVLRNKLKRELKPAEKGAWLGLAFVGALVTLAHQLNNEAVFGALLSLNLGITAPSIVLGAVGKDEKIVND